MRPLTCLRVAYGSLLLLTPRRRGLGIESMTCAPNAFESGEGLRRLAPEESFTSSWGITPVARSRNPATGEER